jgi:hypothetical protein
MSIDETLKDRKKTHGDFKDHASISQGLQEVMHTSRNWFALTSVQREGLTMIQHKIARILSGNPDHADHVIDIIGYATLMQNDVVVVPQEKKDIKTGQYGDGV